VQLGERVGGRFEVVELASVGGMSAVYRARDVERGADVAVKVLLDAARHDRERFAAEARLLAEIQHPAIVRYVAHGTTAAGELFLVMEWLEGESLAARLDRGPLGVAEATALGARVAGALGAAHARGVVHRDVTPRNVILVDGDIARAKVIDFGIARRPEVSSARAPHTRTGRPVGTPGYMAPEQARAERAIGPAADVFALGCVLYECLTGEPAFRAEGTLAVLAKILSDEPPRARVRRPELSPALDALLARMLAKAAAERPADCAELARTLEAFAAEAPGPASRRLPVAITAAEQRLAEAPRTLLGVATQCVGRERELATVAAAYEQCADEHVARAVVVIGEAGAGKTRLGRELAARLGDHDDPPALWTARADALGAGASFGLLAQLVRRTAGLQASMAPEVRRDRLLARVTQTVGASDARRVAEFLGEIVGAAFPDDASPELRTARVDAALMGGQIRRAWLDLVAAECAAHPLVIVLEDLQWGDDPSLRCLDATLGEHAERRLLVLGLGRPETLDLFPDLWAERSAMLLRLGALTPRSSEKLLRNVLPDASAETIARLVALGAGNALFLEELARSTAEGRTELPTTVLATVQERLGEIDPEARRVLRAGSVFGGVFWTGGVVALLGGRRRSEDARSWLGILEERELVLRQPASDLADEETYAFRHAIVRDAAYAMLTDEDRRLGHRLAAEWLEHAGVADPFVLAHHFELGGEPARAAHFYIGAAAQALEGNDYAGVLDRVARAARCTRDPAELGRSRLLEAEAHNWRGAFAEAERCAVEAMQLLAAGSDAWCRAASEVADAAGRLGHLERLQALVAELLAEPRFETGPYLVACARAAMQLYFVGASPPPDALVARVEALARDRADDALTLGWVCRLRAYRATLDGDVVGALRLNGLAAEHYRHAGEIRLACLELNNYGDQYRLLGDFGRAERALRRAAVEADRLGLALPAAVAKQNLVVTLVGAGRLEEARALATEVVRTGIVLRNPRNLAFALATEAQVLLATGQPDRAEQSARAAVEHAAPAPAVHAFALGILARILVRLERFADALATAQAGLALAEGCGGIEEGEELLRVCEVEALIGTGERAQAGARLEEARRRLLERAARIDDEALRASFLGCTWEHARIVELSAAPGAA
jgi:tetratricopeptide (TPR) repeat protein